MSARCGWLVVLGLLVLKMTPTAQADNAATAADMPPVTIVRLAVDPERTTPYIVLTHPNEATAIEVPWEIEDWAGRGFTPDPTQIAGDFYLALRKGERVCFVSPLSATAQRTLHLVMQGVSYPIEMRPAAQQFAFRRVVLFDPVAEQKRLGLLASASNALTNPEQSDPGVEAVGSEPVQRLRSAPKQAMVAASDDLQLGLIRFMQMLCTMDERQAKAAIKANPALSWALRKKDPLVATDDFSLAPQFVVRNNQMRAIGLAVVVHNLTARRLTFVTDSFVLRSGHAVYPATAVDFNPVLEPGAKHMAFLVIARTADGGAVNLSCQTPMQLSLALASSGSVRPAAAVSLQDVLTEEQP